MIPIQTSVTCTHKINGDNQVQLKIRFAVLTGAHVRNMDYNVHMHVENVKFAFGFSSK